MKTDDVPNESGLLYHEFKVGSEFRTDSREISRKDILRFARLTGDDNPLHVSAHASKEAGFEDVMAHGLFLQSITMGLIADLGIMRGTTVALLGSKIRFVQPAFPGDVVTAVVRITRKRPTSSPTRGLLWRRAVLNRLSGEVLVESSLTALVRRIPPDGETKRR